MKLLKNKYFYLAIFVGLIVIFVLQNFRRVEINFLFWNLIRINLAFLLSSSLTLGLVIGSVTTWLHFKKKERNAR